MGSVGLNSFGQLQGLRGGSSDQWQFLYCPTIALTTFCVLRSPFFPHPSFFIQNLSHCLSPPSLHHLVLNSHVSSVDASAPPTASSYSLCATSPICPNRNDVFVFHERGTPQIPSPLASVSTPGRVLILCRADSTEEKCQEGNPVLFDGLRCFGDW